HIPELAHRQPLAKSFVISEEEHLVAADRPSQRSAKLVPLKRRYRRRIWSFGDVKEVPRVQGAVAQILENGSTPLIRSRSGYNGDLRPGPFSIFGAIGVPKDVEFTHGVYAEQIPAYALGRGIGSARVVPDVVHSIHREP